MVGARGGLTFVFTDIEGSTQLLRDMQTGYGLALRIHRRILETCFEEHGGSKMGTEGDAVFFVFTEPSMAATAALAAQQRFEHYGWPDGMRLRVRIGIHCGPVTVSDGEFVGLTVHEAARICAAAHGGQILCSGAVAEHLGEPGSAERLDDLGTYLLRGFPDERHLYQVTADGLEDDFPPPREAVRAGGVRISMWRRDDAAPRRRSRPRPAEPATGVDLDLRARDGSPLGPEVVVEVGRASNGPPGAFRVIVRRQGVVEEEYDGLTLAGATAASAIVNAYSRLIRIGPPTASS